MLLVEWPPAGHAIWAAFNRMGRQYVTSGMGGLTPLPLSMTEIDAWQRVHRIRLTPWELAMIFEFDSIVLAAAQKGKA